MRTSTLLTAAFAGVALSSPLVKRDVVLEIDTVVDVVYVTQYLTETAGAATATSEAEVTSTVAPATSTLVASSSTPVAKSFYESESSWSSAWTSTYAASSVATSSVSVATSSSSVYVAPSSSETSATSSATSSAAETTSKSAASAAATSYQQIVIAHHNVHRANHSAGGLTWSDSLASTAASIAANCVYAHNVTANGGGYGQNIAAGVPASNVSFVISDLFYNGEVNNFNGLYGQANPSMANFENWGHFSQIVWKATTQVGCHTQDCSATGLANTGSYVSPYFTVCNYQSPGNYGGEYAAEIGEPLGEATVNWNYDL